MKIVFVLLLVAAATASPNVFEDQQYALEYYETLEHAAPEGRNFLINALIRQLLEFLRNLISNGNDLFGIPPLDPLKIENLHLEIPAGLINLKLNLTDAMLTGIGAFKAHRTHLNTSDISFDIEISVPELKISAGSYHLDGDILTAIPIYGDGGAEFIVNDFRFKAKLFLKQSDNKKSAILDRIENLSFEIPNFKSNITGAIGGGDIDKIVDAVLEEVIIGYVNRFRSAISKITNMAVIAILNPILEQLDTWRWIDMILPRA
ncbi:uncharacterized protein LOC123717790 [Pieris brassicae]|uniref:Hemolymph juvenile hormone binding protein n=1 Tax=Pieris brassicae TaxID=7116 RepID=A0A9P0XDG1_PIEBR|nr:uncharacterized protein LOC123717790 [Pieris brassicae]CAH4030781.1 unnamed protein product [Pieris brassicae]